MTTIQTPVAAQCDPRKPFSYQGMNPRSPIATNAHTGETVQTLGGFVLCLIDPASGRRGTIFLLHSWQRSLLQKILIETGGSQEDIFQMPDEVLIAFAQAWATPVAA